MASSKAKKNSLKECGSVNGFSIAPKDGHPAPKQNILAYRMSSDADMEDAPAVKENGGQHIDKDTPLDDGYRHWQRIRVLPGASDTAASFEIMHEDHTLGNALRHIIMKNPDVEFCGYSIPHPADPKMNIRIQTFDDVSVYDVLQKGLDDLEDVCDVMLDKFRSAKNEFGKQEETTT